jgi:hypothetical protein
MIVSICVTPPQAAKMKMWRKFTELSMKTMKHDLVEHCKASLQYENARELQGSTCNTLHTPVSLCLSCSPMSKINSNIWPGKTWLWFDTFFIHLIWPLMTISNDEITSYTQFQNVSSKIPSSSRRKTHSINLEGTGLKWTCCYQCRLEAFRWALVYCH